MMKSKAVCCLCFLFLSLLLAGGVKCSVAQEVNLDFPDQTLDQWHGFTRHKFQFEGREAWVVEPQRPRADRLFSWCLMFPDAFTERCAAPQLLAEGFYHVYCDVGNTFGAPEAVEQLSRFHDELCRRGLAQRAVLIGISRGGLYAHNYAVAHPERVAVIYGDAAVLDFKSWPAGFGKGKGSAADWQELLKLYKFADEAAAKAYTGNPVDQLKSLQQAGVALIYVVGDTDDVVPWSENTQLVETRYRELGGVVEVLHKPEVGHHPHGLDDPLPVVRFVLRHAPSGLYSPPAGGAARANAEIGEAADTIEQLSSDWSKARKLYPGVEHQRWVLQEPRPLVVNCLRIDPKAPGLKFHSTGRIEGWENGVVETRRETVRDYLRAERAKGVPLVVAINADAFTLKTAYNRKDPCDLLGLAVADGATISSPTGSPSLIVRENGDLKIEALAKDASLDGIEVAVSGFGLCLQEGKPLPSGEDLHPRTGFGLSEKGDYLFLVTIDGRQPASQGATTAELGSIMAELGAHVAINMDGGGSTTLAWWNPERGESEACELLNQPVGNGQGWDPKAEPAKFRATERTNGNNFGISWSEK